MFKQVPSGKPTFPNPLRVAVIVIAPETVVLGAL